jgi:hypothetical protein
MYGLVIFAATVLLNRSHGTPCRAALVPAHASDFSQKEWACIEYAETSATKGRSVVVYALEERLRRANDFKHRVFIALLAEAPGKQWKVLDRSDVTNVMLDMDEDEDHGVFREMDATIVAFTLTGRRERFFDVRLGSLLSGTGAISASTDVLLRVNGDRLQRTGTLRFTDSWTRSGWSYVSETRSELLVGKEGLLLVLRSSTGRAQHHGDPLVVHCRVSRRHYVYRSGTFRETGPMSAREASRLDMRPLRVDVPAYLPCCAGCTFTDIH